MNTQNVSPMMNHACTWHVRDVPGMYAVRTGGREPHDVPCMYLACTRYVLVVVSPMMNTQECPRLVSMGSHGRIRVRVRARVRFRVILGLALGLVSIGSHGRISSEFRATSRG